MTEARAEFSELINRVAYGGEPVVITRHGKPLVALVPASYIDEASDFSPTAPVTVLDVTARSGDSSGAFTVAAQRDDPTAR